MPNLVVDVHVEIDNPNLVDAWRLQQFVESQGDVLEFNKAEAILQSSADAGLLIKRRGCYELKV